MSGGSEDFVARLRANDPTAWPELLATYRERLERAVSFRLDRRLRGRVDAADVIQEVCLEAYQRLPAYLAKPDMPIHLWLRFLAGQRVLIIHRQHFGTAMRNPGREQVWPDSTSDGLAEHLMATGPSPSQDAARAEAHAYLRQSLESMDGIDREVLTLRHFEQLSNNEVAQLLGIEPSAASKRYLRALGRLQEIMSARPDLMNNNG